MLRRLSPMIWCLVSWDTEVSVVPCNGVQCDLWHWPGQGVIRHAGGTAVRVILELRSPTAHADDEVQQQISLVTFTYLDILSVLALPGLQPPVLAYGLGA